MAMSHFTREKIRSMEAELQAAKEEKLESLLYQQLEVITALSEKCESFFQKAVANNRKLVDDLETKIAEAENWRVKKRTEKKLDIVKESLEKKEEDHATDVKMLEKHKEKIRMKIESAKNDKAKYIAEVKKEKAAHEKELKELKTKMVRRAILRGAIAIALVFGAFIVAVGGFLAAPFVAAAGAVVAGVSAITGLFTLLFGK